MAKNVLQEVIVKSGKIPLVGDRVTQETDRIFGLIREDSDKQKRDIKEIFAISGVPGSEKKSKR
ncbi:MAG: hypothetical protein HC932_00925 [Thermales bacterium]|nr:hypothetical protein [Thermales bacterium]